MKKNFYFAALAGMLALFSACSKDQEGSSEQSGAVLPEMTIKLESPETYATSASEGTESNINGTDIFVWVGDDATGANPHYAHVALQGDVKQATIKFPINGKNVFVFANATPEQINEAQNCNDEAGFEAIEVAIEKSYIGGLKTTGGSFMMSGKAMVNKPATGTTAYVLPVILERNIAKATLQVKPVPIGTNPADDTEGAPILNSIGRIMVVRGAPMVAPFKMDGATTGGYALTPGYGQTGYIGDYEAQLGAAAGTIKNTQTSAANVTDFTFEYTGTTKDKDDNEVFAPFYVLPNYAETASCGTVIILEANITNPVGGLTNAKRYYKARISKLINTYDTRRNSHYIITATLKGNGSDTPNPGEDEANNMIVSVKVSQWTLELSNQDIE